MDSENTIFRHIHHTDTATIKKMYLESSPVFTLTTGRSGTKFLSVLFGLSDNVKSYHEVPPGLQYFVNFAFHNQHKKELLTKMVDGARMELMLDAYIKNKIYIECNQCLTFFSYQLKDLFKSSKFIHIVRHPGDFISSAVGKGFYKNDSLWEMGRIRRKSNKHWSTMDQLEKLAWNWKTTNEYAERFKHKVPNERFITVKIEDVFNNIEFVKKMIEFAGIDKISDDDITKLQQTKINQLEIGEYEPPNMFKRSDFPEYSLWTADMKEKIKPFVMDQCAIYNYFL